MTARAARRRSAVPGPGLAVVPLAAMLARAAGVGWEAGLPLLASLRALAAFRISFGAARAGCTQRRLNQGRTAHDQPRPRQAEPPVSR